MMTYQDIIKETKLVDFPKYHQAFLPALKVAHQRNCLLLNMGLIVLTNHTSHKDFAYNSLLGQYIAAHTNYTDPVSQSLTLRPQLKQLSNVYSNSKSTWQKVEKSAGGYPGQLKMDSSGERKNPGGRKCYKCGSTGHYKKDCPKRRQQVATAVVIIVAVMTMGQRSGIMRIRMGRWKFRSMERSGNWCKNCGFTRK